MKPRIVDEFGIDEQPLLSHAVRYASAAASVISKLDAEAGSVYQTMCGERLFSPAKRVGRRRGIPACIRCTIVMVEEASLWL